MSGDSLSSGPNRPTGRGESSGSYSSGGGGIRGLTREARNLLGLHRRDIPVRVAEMVKRLDEISTLIIDRYGVELEGLDVLDVGAGQFLGQMAYFARHNDIVGIDSDVIAHGFALRSYLEMLRENGLKRTVKTVGRKAVGIDRRYRLELRRKLGVSELGRPDVHHMSAERMAFADASFDFVYSLVVFQHLRDPAAVLDEMVRVTRPDGIVYIDFILYSSRTGCHDFRLLGGRDAGLPLWPHLRPAYKHLVLQSAYLNRFTLAEWQTLFRDRMAGCDVIQRQPERDWLEAEAQTLVDAGELDGYSLDDLLTTKVVVTWRKPAR